jgi:archaemetzincin
MKMNVIGFLLLLAACNTNIKSISKQHVIAIQPIQPFQQSFLPILQKNITSFYHCKVIILNPITLPLHQYSFTKGKRIFANHALQFLKNNKPDSIDYILGFTNQDICINKYDAFGNIKSQKAKYESFGIFGLGFQPGCANIISTHRLQTNNQSLFQKRIIHVTLHELGHNFGLPHCKSLHCFMQDAEEKMSTLDEENIILCANCKG